MTVYFAENNDAPKEMDVQQLDGVAGEIICLDCDGTGEFAEPDEPPGRQCVTCKGSRRVLVSI